MIPPKESASSEICEADGSSKLDILNVSVAVLLNSQNQILITQRPAHVLYGNFWELPGGKIEAGETPEIALIREVKEELDILVLAYQLLGTVSHQTLQHRINLHAFQINHFEGDPHCQESQLAYRWVRYQDLMTYSFPEATNKLITRYLNI